MKDYFINLARYNTWANRKIEGFVKEAGEMICTLQQPSSFKSVRETLIHIWDAQAIWLDRVHGREVVTWPGKNFTGSTMDASAKLVENSIAWTDFINGIDESKMSDVCQYRNIKGDIFSSGYYQIFSHLFNHGTYHRGQIVTLLRGAGFENPGSTDLINFYRETA